MSKIPACNCGCGLDALEPEMFNIAELLETEFPGIIWTRGPSCEKHNKMVGGTANSGHLPKHGETCDKAVALDGTLQLWDNGTVRRILWRAIQHGARGVGYYPPSKRRKRPSFHIDRKPRVQFWTLDLLGRLKYFFK